MSSPPSSSSSIELYAVHKNSDESECIPYACLEARRKLRSYSKLVSSIVKTDALFDSINEAVRLTKEDSPFEPSVETSPEVHSSPIPLEMDLENKTVEDPMLNKAPESDMKISRRGKDPLGETPSEGDRSTSEASGGGSPASKKVSKNKEKGVLISKAGCSSLSPKKLRSIATEFYISSEYKLIAPSRHQSVFQPPTGFTAVYKAQLQCGLRFPLTSFLKKIIEFYRLNLTQLILNAIRTLVGFESFCQYCKVKSTVSLFRYYYVLKSMRGEDGGFTFFRRSSSETFLPPLPVV